MYLVNVLGQHKPELLEVSTAPGWVGLGQDDLGLGRLYLWGNLDFNQSNPTEFGEIQAESTEGFAQQICKDGLEYTW